MRLEPVRKPIAEPVVRVQQTERASADALVVRPSAIGMLLAKPVATTAPAGVSITQAMTTRNASDLTARIRSVLTARWTNTTTPGRQFILERQDKTQIDRLRVGVAWVEIKQVNDPVVPELTEMTVDTTRQEPLTTRATVIASVLSSRPSVWPEMLALEAFRPEPNRFFADGSTSRMLIIVGSVPSSGGIDRPRS